MCCILSVGPLLVPRPLKHKSKKLIYHLNSSSINSMPLAANTCHRLLQTRALRYSRASVTGSTSAREVYLPFDQSQGLRDSERYLSCKEAFESSVCPLWLAAMHCVQAMRSALRLPTLWSGPSDKNHSGFSVGDDLIPAPLAA